jgi:hypothetical protein
LRKKGGAIKEFDLILGIADTLPISTPLTTTIDIQISYISGAKSSPSCDI